MQTLRKLPIILPNKKAKKGKTIVIIILSPRITIDVRRHSKKLQMQGAQIRQNEAYLPVRRQ
jgi:hypothetical protein